MKTKQYTTAPYYYHNVVHIAGFELTMSVVIGTNCKFKLSTNLQKAYIYITRYN